MSQGQCLDFGTYFTFFCLGKWKKYTTIRSLRLSLKLRGRFKVDFYAVDAQGNVAPLFSDVCYEPAYKHEFSLFEPSLAGTLLGFMLTPLEDGVVFIEGAWYGDFDGWAEKTIGVSICTFKREKNVTRTMQTLERLALTNPWLRILVVDNGETLPVRDDGTVRVVHNRNYGGSGGFTRGMIEYVEGRTSPSYVLLMDDDIVLDTTAIERTHSLLCGLKEKYSESFVA